MDETKKQKTPVNVRYVIPFFLVLAILTVCAFIIPLRPTRSQSEKRNLAQFPEFTVEALLSGSYFDDITLWFSDTFPGRESWIQLSGSVSELHGYSEITIQGNLPISDQIPVIPTGPSTDPTENTEATEETEPTEPETTKPTLPDITIEEVEPPTEDVEVWGGVNAGEDAQIMYANQTIQIGDTVFNYCAFHQYGAEVYAQTTNNALAALEGTGARLASMPSPTAIGIMVEKEYQSKLGCAPQDEIINYMFSLMDEDVYKVDLYSALVEHNDEYIYYRTDHHWSSLGAYYAYEALCEAFGYEAAPLSSFEEWDQGVYEGSIYYSAARTSKLKVDNVYAYIPQGDIEMVICRDGRSGFDWPILTDMRNSGNNTKYMTFLAGDHALCIITNNSIPDAPNCLVIKDSYGNPVAPYLTQNYHKVYVIDYRKYGVMKLRAFVEQYEIDDVVLINNLNAAQYVPTCDTLNKLFK